MELKYVVAKRVAFNKSANKEFVDVVKNKLKLPFPSEKEALDILSQYTKNDDDIDKAYRVLPKILNFFKSKKSFDLEAGYSVFPPEFFRGLIILSAMVAISQGMLPDSSREAQAKLSELKVEHHIVLENGRTNFEYLGTLEPHGVGKLVEDSEDFYEALNEIRLGLSKPPTRRSVTYKGYVPGDANYRLYKDRGGKQRITSLKELKDLRQSVFLGY